MYKVGKLFGIDIYLHYSWFVILPLFTYSLSGPLINFYSTLPIWGIYLLSFVLVIFIFLGLLAHELAHALEARRQNITVHNIILLLFGGIAQVDLIKIKNPGQEFKCVIVGPLVTLAITTILYLALLLVNFISPFSPVLPALGLLFWIHVMVTVFNLIPMYPLDGGRLLRDGLWALFKNRLLATKISLVISSIVFILLVIKLTSPWIMFIGAYIIISGFKELKQLKEYESKIKEDPEQKE